MTVPQRERTGWAICWQALQPLLWLMFTARGSGSVEAVHVATTENYQQTTLQRQLLVCGIEGAGHHLVKALLSGLPGLHVSRYNPKVWTTRIG